MNESIVVDKAKLKRERRRSWLITVLLALVFCGFASVIIILPKTIIYCFSNAIYPNSQNTSSNSGIEPDATLTKLLIYSKSHFETTDNINQVYDWYIQHGWKEVGRNQGIALENSRGVDLLINYKLKFISSISVIQLGQRTDTEVSTQVFLFH